MKEKIENKMYRIKTIHMQQLDILSEMNEKPHKPPSEEIEETMTGLAILLNKEKDELKELLKGGAPSKMFWCHGIIWKWNARNKTLTWNVQEYLNEAANQPAERGID